MTTEYPKIETLYERDMETFKVRHGVLKNDVYGLVRSWHWTEKIDGTNIRIVWDRSARGFSFRGRSDNAQMDRGLLKRLGEIAVIDRFGAAFGDNDAVVYGEGYGAGIQKGGAYGPTKDFIAFDIFVLDSTGSRGGWWLNVEDFRRACDTLALPRCPEFGEMTLEEATRLVAEGVDSRIGSGKAEGLVGRTSEPLFDSRGHRLIVKLKTKDFTTTEAQK